MHVVTVFMLIWCAFGVYSADDNGAAPSSQPAVYADMYSAERKLYDYLMAKDRYNKYIRPVRDEKDTIKLGFELNLIQAVQVEEVTSTLTTRSWLKLSWKDEFLKWNPQDYNDVSAIRIPIEQIWKPDLHLYNGLHDAFQNALEHLPVIRSTGDVLWIPEVLLQTSCVFDLTRFPYDEHTCLYKFGSWSYDSTKVNLTWFGEKPSVNIDYYTDHPEFDLSAVDAERHDKKYACCVETYPDITYSITIKRNYNYHDHMFVAPSFAMVFLVPSVFVLPPDSPSKITLGVGVLIANSVMLAMLESYIPTRHPTVPMISVFYLTNMIFVAISTAFAAIIVNVWAKSERNNEMPRILKTVVLGIFSRLLCVKRDTYMSVPSNEPQRLDVLADDEPENGSVRDRTQIIKTANRAANSAEWCQLAVVLDRLCFVLFMAIIILVSIILLR